MNPIRYKPKTQHFVAELRTNPFIALHWNQTKIAPSPPHPIKYSSVDFSTSRVSSIALPPWNIHQFFVRIFVTIETKIIRATELRNYKKREEKRLFFLCQSTKIYLQKQNNTIFPVSESAVGVSVNLKLRGGITWSSACALQTRQYFNVWDYFGTLFYPLFMLFSAAGCDNFVWNRLFLLFFSAQIAQPNSESIQDSQE